MIDSKLPWLSSGGNRTDLDSSSSLSLLHSIYGSQVSQVLQASDDSETNLFATSSESPRHVDQHFPAQCRSRRPMSSPAATRLEREKKTRPSLRPASALRNRPQTARVHPRPTPAGRPKTAIGIRAVLVSEDGGIITALAHSASMMPCPAPHPIHAVFGRCRGGGIQRQTCHTGN